MRVNWGIDASKKTPVIWDSTRAVNGHMLLMGMSGAGKTHQLRKIIREMEASAPPDQPLRVRVFDVHGDIEIEGASTVMYSEQTEYGLNPLAINPDPHYGGIRKRIQSVIATINKTSRALGGKQEAVLRNILADLYAQHGFKHNDPSTWAVDPAAQAEPEVVDGRLYLDVPIEEKDEAKQHGARWDGDKKCWWIAADAYNGPITRWLPKRSGRRYPTMADALRFANKMLKIAFLGSNQEAVSNLEAYNRAARAYQAKVIAATKKGEKLAEDEKLKSDLEKAGQKAVDSYTAYVESIKNGRELDDLIKYDSVDVLKSVVDRLENLLGIGIFKNKLPPHDPNATVWRDHIKALGKDEQKLFVLFSLEELFQAAVQRGETPYITDVIIVDEASNFFDDADDNILNTIAKEARKFGVALICASQAPTHFTDDFVSSVGTKIVLGIDEMYWDSSTRKLRLDLEALKWIRLKERVLVQVKQSGEARNDWRWTYLESTPGRRDPDYHREAVA